jgi:hypothetical protein
MAVIYETEKVSEVDALVISSNPDGYRQVACACVAISRGYDPHSIRCAAPLTMSSQS